MMMMITVLTLILDLTFILLILHFNPSRSTNQAAWRP
jgi:hypothetical protein